MVRTKPDKSLASIDAAASVFKALGDPTRLRLLCLLLDGERCVCELTDAVEEAQPKISRHLAALRKAGLVATRRDGLWIHYRLAEPTHPLMAQLRDCLTSCRGVPDVKQDLQRMNQCCRG